MNESREMVRISVQTLETKKALGRAGYNVRQIEGYQNANWILMDYKDVVIHIFDRQSRDFYDLERIWRDAKELSPDEFLAEGEKESV